MDARSRVRGGDDEVLASPTWGPDRVLGRDGELSELTALLRSHRLVTVTGVGGVGKTTLVGAVVHAVDRTARVEPVEDVAVVLLARHRTAEQVAPAVAEAVGQPSWDAALSALAERAVLVVLDNCEHLLDAVADVVEELLAQSPRSRVLTTSREPLALAGERVLPLDPLAVVAAGADPQAAVDSPAVRLFLARAAQAGVPVDRDPDSLATVVELCRRLDGLPLAIELAAARTRTMTPAEILRHLDRRLDLLVSHRRAPDRHRSLEALVDWSYDRLDPALRRFFNRLGVAEGSFTAEAAHAVAAEPGEDLVTVLGYLDQLVAQSLVQVHRRGGRTRYGLLETLRAYARARLEESGEREAVTSRCVDWTVRHCLELRSSSRSSWSPEFTSLEETVRLDVVDALHRVLRTDASPDRAYPLLSLLWDADVHNGRAVGTAELGERVLARWPDSRHPGWPEAAAVLATAHVVLGNRRRATELAHAALAADPQPLAAVMALRALFLVALDASPPQRALEVVADAVCRAQAAGLRPWEAELRSLRAIALAAADRLPEALDDIAAAERDANGCDSPLLAAWCALVRGHVLARTDPAAAREVLAPLMTPDAHGEPTGAPRHDAHEPLDVALAHRAVAVLTLSQGDPHAAATGLRAALDTLVGLGQSHVGTTLRWVAATAQACGLRAEAADLDAVARGLPAAELSDRLSAATLERVAPLVGAADQPVADQPVADQSAADAAAGANDGAPTAYATATRAAVATGRSLLDRIAALPASAPRRQAAVPQQVTATEHLTTEEPVTAVAQVVAATVSRGAAVAVPAPTAAGPGSGAVAATVPVAVFRRAGAVWTLTYAGTTILLPDMKGMHDLAVLLASPGTDVRCTDLMGAAVEERDTGPLLDQQARRSYEQRIVALQSDLVEAEDAGDQSRADRARVEMDFLVDQLLAATGRTGRARRTGGTHEKARSAVGWRVRAAIGRVAREHPELGRHLKEAVRLGAWCSYRPTEPVDWQL